MAYGVPCIQITRETTEPNSPFNIKIVMAEVESGKEVMLENWYLESSVCTRM